MGLFGSRRGVDTSFPKEDRGFGSFDDYVYNLEPRSKRTTMTLANSNPYQDELRELAESNAETIETAISPRTLEQERVNDEIWLPSVADINLSVRVLLVKGISVNQQIRSYDYRRSETEVKDATVGEPDVN